MLQMVSETDKTQRSEVKRFMKKMKGVIGDQDVSKVGFYKARMKYSPDAIYQFFVDLTDDIYSRGMDDTMMWNGYHILAIDGSDVTLPSDMEICHISSSKPVNQSDADPAPMCKLSIIFDAISRVILRVEIDEYKHDERDHAAKLIKALPESMRKNIIVIMDRGYYSMKLVDLLEDLGIKYLFRIQKPFLNPYVRSMEIGGIRDIIYKPTFASTNGFRNETEVRKKIMSREYPMRIAKIDIGTDEPEVLVTNLATIETADEFKYLYHLRWGIETCYRECKSIMRMEEFNSRKETIILQDFYADFIVYNIQSFVMLSVEPKKGLTYEMRLNRKVAYGELKDMLVELLIEEDGQKRDEMLRDLLLAIQDDQVPRRDNRSYARNRFAKNKSKMSYRPVN